MTKIILIQGSLNKNSRTALVVKRAATILTDLGVENEIIDLRDYDIPFCDGRSTYAYGDVVVGLYRKLKAANAFILSSPVYAYTYSGAFKNFIDIFGGSMVDKYSGAIFNAGGSNSYLASGELVKIMAFDYNHTIIMPTVYTYKKHFVDGELQSDYVEKKLNQMIISLLKATNIRSEMELIRCN